MKALKGKGKGKGKGGLEKKGNRAQGGSGKGDDWDLDNGVSGGNQGSLMEVDVRNGLPVCVTLNLVCFCFPSVRSTTRRVLTEGSFTYLPFLVHI